MRKTSLVIQLLFSLGLATCSKTAAPTVGQLPFADDFSGAALGDHWSKTPGWRIVDGQAFSSGTHNEALWLSLSLPDDAVIELDARSESPAGDIKFEIYGDGKTHASGYILIFGGWNNSISTIARLDEHGADRQELHERGLVKMGQTYHMKVVRRDKTIRWYVDGKLLLDYYDPEPLRGAGHDRLALNDWAAQLYFDNLKVRRAGPEDK